MAETSEEKLRNITYKFMHHQQVTADEVRILLDEINYLNTVIKHLNKDLAKTEEDKEYNATLCQEKDKEIESLKENTVKAIGCAKCIYNNKCPVTFSGPEPFTCNWGVRK